MGVPNSITGTSWAINPISTATHQFVAMYRRDGELLICRIQRGVERFGVDHDQYLVAGAPRTALALPVQADEHAAPSIAVDGTGRLWVWANMHNNTLRVIKTVNPHTTDGWLTDAGWTEAGGDFPSVDIRCTYPTPVHLPDGSLFFYLRNGPANAGSGHIDAYFWKRTPTGSSWSARTLMFQGVSVPEAGGPGVPGGGLPSTDTEATNWSPYPGNFYVETPRDPHPGRIHVFWVWRVEQTNGLTNVLPSYAYSDDGGTTWRAIDGTALSLPMTPLNALAARIPLGSAFVRSVARGSNLVVAELDSENHGFQVGDPVTLYSNSVLAGTFTISAVLANPPRLLWGQVGADVPSGGTGSVCKFQWTNGNSITVDPSGLPHILMSIAPTHYIRRNADNTAWVRSNVPNPLESGGPLHTTVWGGAFWFRGQLWGVVLSGPGIADRVRIYQITGTPREVTASGIIGNNWDPGYDPEAWRRFGTIETLTPDGDRPGVFTFGRRIRVKVAA